MFGVLFGILAYFVWSVYTGFYQLNPNERAVKTSFGRAVRANDIGGGMASDDFMRTGNEDGSIDIDYRYPKLMVIGPGLHFKWPWEKIYRVSIATQTADIGIDPSRGDIMFSPESGHFLIAQNHSTSVLEAVTKDQLNTKISGQIRFRVSENNLYAFFFGIKNPTAHVMGFFHSILREKIANYEAPKRSDKNDDDDLLHKTVDGISVNDLRKNLQDINAHMERECACSAARYGIILEAALITNIDPPTEVDSALAAINTAHNQVASDISVAQASADQTIVQSKRAVEIETLKAQAEVEPLKQLYSRLKGLRDGGGLYAYLRNIKLELLNKAGAIVMEDSRK